jgi:hypothetical protein
LASASVAALANDEQSQGASIAKAKAGCMANQMILKCVELAGVVGYGEDQSVDGSLR